MKGFGRVNKQDYIIQSIRPGSKVLHIGCTNSPNTYKRWESGTLLHKILCDKAVRMGAKVIGIDIDDEGIEFLKQKMPNEEIFNIDAHCLSEKLEERSFDLIIAGDVIEHLPNPGLFLDSCAQVLVPDGRIIITTTNAFGIVRFVKALLFHEAVHDEHTAYFSHKVLSRLFKMSGLCVDSLGYYKCEPLDRLDLNRAISNTIENVFCVFFPQFSEGVIAVAKKRYET